MRAAPRTTDRSSRARGLIVLLVLLTLIAFAGLLAACGDDADEPGPPLAAATPASLATIADRTTATDGLRLSLRQTMTVAGEGTIPVSAEGRFDTKRQRGEMTMSVDSSSLAGGGGRVVQQRMIYDGRTFYMSSPMLQPILPAGKRWTKVDLDASGTQDDLDLAPLMSAAADYHDPTQLLAYLRAASGDVERVGTETVRGVATTHFKATVDFRKLPDTMPADQRTAMRRSIEQLIELGGSSRAPIEVWIDADGHARRLLTTTTTGAAAQRVDLRQRIELYDFGTKVDVKIPPPGAVVDFGDLRRLGDLVPGVGAGTDGFSG